MQGIFYWGMKEVDLLSLNDYSYLRENYMFTIYPVEGPLNIFKADQSRIISKPILKRDFYRRESK